MLEHSKDSQPTRSSASGDRSVDEWAVEFFPSPGKNTDGSDKPHVELWKHSAAAGLHGWAAHEFHANGPMKLSRDAYEAAIKAATEPSAADGQPRAHKVAISPHAPHISEGKK